MWHLRGRGGQRRRDDEEEPPDQITMLLHLLYPLSGCLVVWRSPLCVRSATDGAPRDADSRRRDGTRADRGDPPRPRGDRRRVQLGRAGGRSRRDGDRRHAAPRGDARVGQAEQGGAEGADHDADRHGLPLRQRGAPPRARPLRLPPPLQDLRGRALALRRRRPRARPREHRRPLRGDRVRGGHAGGGAGDQPAERAAGEEDRRRLGHLRQADQPRGLRADHPLRVRVRARPRPQARLVRDEGEHHEVHRRALPRRLPRRRAGVPRDRAVGEPRRRDLHGPRAAAGGVRRARAAEPLRGHRQRPDRRASSAASASRRAATSARTRPSSRPRTARPRSTRARTRSTRPR